MLLHTHWGRLRACSDKASAHVARTCASVYSKGWPWSRMAFGCCSMPGCRHSPAARPRRLRNIRGMFIEGQRGALRYSRDLIAELRSAHTAETNVMALESCSTYIANARMPAVQSSLACATLGTTFTAVECFRNLTFNSCISYISTPGWCFEWSTAPWRGWMPTTCAA